MLAEDIKGNICILITYILFFRQLTLKSDAESPFYYYDLIYKMETGRFKEAKEAFETKIKLNPTQDYLV